MAGQRVRVDAQKIVAAAAAAGKIPSWRAGYWAARIRQGGQAGGQAVAELLAMHPAPPEVVRRWDAEARPGGPARAAAPEGDDLYALLYPEDDPVRGRAVYDAWLRGRDQTAERWQQQHTPPPGGEMRAAAAGFYTDTELYERLFGA